MKHRKISLFNFHIQLHSWPTWLRLSVPVPSLYSASPGTSRMEERASIQPTTCAQAGYVYQRLKVRGVYQIKEHIKEPCENKKKRDTVGSRITSVYKFNRTSHLKGKIGYRKIFRYMWSKCNTTSWTHQRDQRSEVKPADFKEGVGFVTCHVFYDAAKPLCPLVGNEMEWTV